MPALRQPQRLTEDPAARGEPVDVEDRPERLIVHLPVLGERSPEDGLVHRAIIEYGSAAILAVGVFWFVSRSYG